MAHTFFTLNQTNMPCNTPPMYDYINCDGSITPPNPRLITNVVPAIDLVIINGEYVEDGCKPTRKIKSWRVKDAKRSEYKESARRAGKTQEQREYMEDKYGRRSWVKDDQHTSDAFSFGHAVHNRVFNDSPPEEMFDDDFRKRMAETIRRILEED